MRKLALADLNADADFSTEKFAHADSSTVVRISALFCGFCMLGPFVASWYLSVQWLFLKFLGFQLGFHSP